MSGILGKVLVVDDEEPIRSLVCRWLEDEGYECYAAGDAAEALAALDESEYETLLLDIKLPQVSGVELLARAKERFPDAAVIMMTGSADEDAGRRSMELGAHGLLVKPLTRVAVTVNTAGAFASRRKTLRSRGHREELEAEVRRRTEETRAREEEIALRLVAAAEYRDEEPHGHLRRIGMYSEVLARALGVSHHDAEDIRIAAPMHDIGKIGIPDGILLKAGELSHQEFEVVKLHTKIGYEMLSGTEVPLLQTASLIALHHHEKWDGSGYPEGMEGSAIPLVARIVAVADVYDSLTRTRPYRPAFDRQRAVEMMHEGRGTHLDPEVFDTFLDALPVLQPIRERYRDPDDTQEMTAFSTGTNERP